MQVTLESWNLKDAEKTLCSLAVAASTTIVEAARLLGITRHALERRIRKHGLAKPWERKDVTQEQAC